MCQAKINTTRLEIMHNLYYNISRLKHLCQSGYRKGHWVHSPFTYAILNNVIFERSPYYSFEQIDKLSKNLTKREINKSVINRRQRELLQRLCAYNDAKTIVELNCGNALSTLYLASNSALSTVNTYETDEDMYNSADILIEKSLLKNIKLHKKDKDICYTKELENFTQIDILHINMCDDDIFKIYTTAKKRSNSSSIFIFSGIDQCRINREYWKKIIIDKNISLSIEIFNMGIVWFNSEIPKQHYKVAF